MSESRWCHVWPYIGSREQNCPVLLEGDRRYTFSPLSGTSQSETPVSLRILTRADGESSDCTLGTAPAAVWKDAVSRLHPPWLVVVEWQMQKHKIKSCKIQIKVNKLYITLTSNIKRKVKMWFLVTLTGTLGCWCQVGWFECFGNCWPRGIFTHSSLLSSHRMVWNKKEAKTQLK